MQADYFRHFVPRRRRQLGITQSDLAQLVGTSRDVIASWESGRRLPKADKRELLEKCLALGIEDEPDECLNFVVAHVGPGQGVLPLTAPDMGIGYTLARGYAEGAAAFLRGHGMVLAQVVPATRAWTTARVSTRLDQELFDAGDEQERIRAIGQRTAQWVVAALSIQAPQGEETRS
jgi:transcriptional regulator with XRE-family HTH domain